MAISLFDDAADQLERGTDLDRLEARGTLRLGIKKAGLNPDRLTLAQLEAVFDKVMPDQLASRGTQDSAAVCSAIMVQIAKGSSGSATTPTNSDDIFERLGGR